MSWPSSYTDLQATPERVVRLIPIVARILKHYRETNPEE